MVQGCQLMPSANANADAATVLRSAFQQQELSQDTRGSTTALTMVPGLRSRKRVTTSPPCWRICLRRGVSGSRIGKGEPGSGQVREWGAGDRDVGGRGVVACDGEWLVVVGCYLLLLVFIGCCSLARLVSPSFPSPPSPPS